MSDVWEFVALPQGDELRKNGEIVTTDEAERKLNHYEDLRQQLEQAQARVAEWVKCSDRPPLMHECVDVWASVVGGHHSGDESRISNCFFDHESERWWRWDWKCEDRVYLCGFSISHWMPLPQPPQEGEGDEH